MQLLKVYPHETLRRKAQRVPISSQGTKQEMVKDRGSAQGATVQSKITKEP